MIRLYAQLSASFKTVSEGLKEGFEELGVLSGYVVGEQLEFDSDPVPGATAPIAVVVGDPGRVWMAHFQGDHKEVWLMLAPNSEGIPSRIKQELTTKRRDKQPVTGLLAPSQWALEVLSREFGGRMPVKLCQHGALRAFQPNPLWLQSTREAWKTQKHLVALHVTSTVSRKGTKELIQAWSDLIEAGSIQGQLLISCNPRFVAEFEDVIRGKHHIRVVPGQGMSTVAFSELMQLANVVIQPSRAEGFGLVPLEARACGVPVVMTAGTGHWDQVAGADGTGVIAIPQGELEASDDYWGARAPTVYVGNIREAIARAYVNWEKLAAQALGNVPNIHRQWGWATGAAKVVRDWRTKYDYHSN